MKYEVISDYCKSNHTITESFIVSNKTALKKKISMMLDAYADYPGDIPKEPDPNVIKAELPECASSDDIKKEIKRMQKMWKVYKYLMSKVDEGVDADYQIDKNWTMIVKIRN